MRKLGIALLHILMVVAANAYRNGRKTSAISPFYDYPPYQGVHQHPPSHEEHEPFREQSFKPQSYETYRVRPYRQNLPYSEQSSRRDQSFEGDYSSFKNRPFHGDQLSFSASSNLKGQSPFSLNEATFQDQSYKERRPFKNENPFHSQYSIGEDRYLYQRPSLRDESTSFPSSVESYQDGSYEKLINSYKGDEGSISKYTDYLKYGNHGLGFASIPTVSPYENALPLSEETTATMSSPTAPTATHKPWLQSTASSTTSPISKLDTSANSASKMASTKSSVLSTTQSVKFNTLADVPTTTAATKTTSTVPTGSDTTKQSSNLGHSTTSLTTVSNLPVMVTKTPIISFGTSTLPGIQFQTTKFTAAEEPSGFYLPTELKSKIQQSLVNQLFLDDSKSTFRTNDRSSIMNYLLSDVSSSNLNDKLQSPMLNYILPEKPKDVLKESLQSSLLNYLLEQGSKRGLSFQQSSLPETVNYVPLARLAERPKLSLPNIPIATLSAVSQPVQTINYVPTTVPRVSFMGMDSSTSSGLPLGTSLSSGIPLNMQDNRPASVFNSLPAGMNNGISGIASNISPGIHSSIPTLNYGQNYQHVGQLQHFGTPRNHQPAYSGGMQLQLGGFGGIDYTLQSSNPQSRPMELGIAKVGLSLPELPRPHVPTFAKIRKTRRLQGFDE